MKVKMTHAAAAWSWVEKMFYRVVYVDEEKDGSKRYTNTGRPSYFGTESNESFDEDRSLNGPNVVFYLLFKVVIITKTHMWRQPAMRAPFKGWEGPYCERWILDPADLLQSPTFFLKYMRPGISFSAISISLRPKAARETSKDLEKCNQSRGSQ